MRIPLNENVYMKVGLEKANAEKYYSALCLFSHCKSYESYINRIMCLCFNRDLSYAGEIYCQFKRIFGKTHNCAIDIEKFLASDAMALLSFTEGAQTSKRKKAESKLSADESLIMRYSEEEDDIDEDSPDLDFFGDSELWSDLDTNGDEVPRMYDLHSEEYSDYLRAKTELLYLRGEKKKAKKYSDRLLAIDTDYLPSLEAQIAIALHSENYAAALEFAAKIAEHSESTSAGIGGAIEAAVKGSGDKALLEKLLMRAYEKESEMKYFDMEEYIEIASNILKDDSLAYKFAEALYREKDSISLDALKLCSLSFYNAKDVKKALEAAKSLTYAVPEDIFAEELVNYINRHRFDEKLNRLDIAGLYVRHFAVPKEMVFDANSALLSSMENIPFSADGDTYKDISVLICYCKSKLLTENMKAFSKASAIIKTVINVMEISDKEKFFKFCEKELAAPLMENGLAFSLLSKLVSLGYGGELMINLGVSSYFFDTSALYGTTAVFKRAAVFLACSAELSKAYVKRLRDAFDLLSEYCPMEIREENYKQIAYFCAKLSLPKNVVQRLGDLFTDEEKALTERFLAKYSPIQANKEKINI